MAARTVTGTASSGVSGINDVASIPMISSGVTPRIFIAVRLARIMRVSMP